MELTNNQTPREIVEELDKYIVGQKNAKRSVAIALRNRWRSRQLDNDSMKDDIIPKNILMIGSTGVGKTEIARRLAKLVKAPFIKVEATKFTEVGYVGRDVESIIRDLTETAIRMVRTDRLQDVQEKAAEMAEERILDVMVPENKTKITNPFGQLFGGGDDDEEEEKSAEEPKQYQAGREWCRKKLKAGEYEENIIEIDIEDNAKHMVGMFAGSSLEGMGDNLQDMIGNMLPKKRKKRKVTVANARKLFQQEEAMKLVDMEEVTEAAVKAAENSGIVFLDEIDKVAVAGDRGGHDVSREGVQRDILPLVEGSTVMTKYGPVKTDHILFIASGAFHVSKPSDLIPELQGRFPIRVELDDLTEEDFVRILTEPNNALLKQYKAFLETEEVVVTFTKESIERIAANAAEMNDETDNIGARRLHTILEKLLEDLLFESPDMPGQQITITA